MKTPRVITKTITRRQVIRAMREEPLLRRKNFFHPSGPTKEGTEPTRPDCAVCAVGAVLRRVSFETWARKLNLKLSDLGQTVTKNEYIDSDPLELIERKNYLGALSCYFEGNKRRTREHMVSFVKKHFPPSFTVTVRARHIETN